VDGRVIGAGVVVALLVVVGGVWSTLKWDEMSVVEVAPDLSPDSDPAAVAPEGAAGVTTTAPSTTTTSIVVPACVIGDNEAEGDPAEDWATIVVDANLGLPSDYEPPDLVDAEAAGFDTGDKIREIIVDDLDALRQAAEDNDTPLGLVSAFRTYAYQKGLYDDSVAQKGEEQAQLGTARPGHSEHQLGTVVDVLAAGSQDLNPTFADTATGKWLAENAAEYGFVLSYPDLPRERTCYKYEPWHLRYVGRDLAPTIRDSQLAPREWMLSNPAPSP
jgi:D-alanyl-D-alanine carboxypeptidase